MISAIGGIGGAGMPPYIDPEYMQIISELKKLGLPITGDKNTDKATLMSEKQKIAEKINKQIDIPQKNQEKSTDEKLTDSQIGAMTVSELNKYFMLVKNNRQQHT